jgi:hypothetical protein
MFFFRQFFLFVISSVMFTVMGEVGEDPLYCPLLSLLILLLSLSSLIWLTVLSCTLNRWVFSHASVHLFTLSGTLKTDVNVPPVSDKQRNIENRLGILRATDPDLYIHYPVHGSKDTDQDLSQNVTVPEHLPFKIYPS